MKAIKIALVVILVFNGLYSLYIWLFSGESTPEPPRIESQAQLPEVEAAEGLDLKALTALTKEVRSGQELERRLNEPKSINNLDLNGDEKVDYIFINEFGDPKSKIGYALTVQPVKGEEQEIASITVEKNQDRAEIQVVGNEQIYGDSAIFNDWAPIERDPSTVDQSNLHGATVHHSYFMPRPLFFSPFYFGFYPPFYSFFPIMSSPMYMNRVTRYNTGTVQRGRNDYQKSSNKKIDNPKQGKTAQKGINRSLRKPTASQKQFRASNRKNVRSGGFGKNTSAASRTKSSTTQSQRRSSTASPDRLRKSRTPGFGQSRSLSRSSGGYFGRGSIGSGGYRSRSFGFGGK